MAGYCTSVRPYFHEPQVSIQHKSAISSYITFQGGTAVSWQRLTKTQSYVTVVTGVSPSFRVGVSFEAMVQWSVQRIGRVPGAVKSCLKI